MKPSFVFEILGFLSVFFLILSQRLIAGTQKDSVLDVTSGLSREILVHGHAYSDLVELVKIGARLTGSKNAAKAVEWGKRKMENYGFDSVWLQSVIVPRWERGSTERATAIIGKHREDLNITALGGSEGTGEEGIKAPVVEVHSLVEVTALGQKVKGKIVFYNRPMDASFVDTFEAYDKAADQRFSGAAAAAKYGAVAVLVRSLTLSLDDKPHTGMTVFDKDSAKIPAAAISTNDAEKLSRFLKSTPNLLVHLSLSAKYLGTTNSFNVIGEITGSQIPTEQIIVGSHLDSWDLAQGAQDDGAGVVQSIQALSAIRSLGLRPRRTLRAVLFMGEEMGGLGGREYAKQAKEKGEKIIAAVESDRGGFTPLGFNVKGKEAALKRLRGWREYLAPIHADLASLGSPAMDIEPLGDLGATLFGLIPDSQRYFDYHHSQGDTIDTVNARELHLGAAAMSILAWVLAEQGI